MPTPRKFICKNCPFEGQNRKILALHMIEFHPDDVHKCPFPSCTFVSAYKTNLMRHARDVHGIRDLKCELCGYFATSLDEIFHHREANHKEELERIEQLFQQQKDCQSLEMENQNLEINGGVDEMEYNDDIFDAGGEEMPNSAGDSANHFKYEQEEENSGDSSMKEYSLAKRRTYSCEQCNLVTQNPREYLRHLRDIHQENIMIHECQHCLYASKHIQKLQRHINLVHSNLIPNDSMIGRNFNHQPPVGISNYHMPPPNNGVPLGMPFNPPPPPPPYTEHQKYMKRPLENHYSCSQCHFQTRSRFLITQHEKSAHAKKTFFRCKECGYVTNKKNRYLEHLRDHSPSEKLKCHMCSYTTGTKSALDEHIASHAQETAYDCGECPFSTNNKQELLDHLKTHLGDTNEQDSLNPEEEEEDEEEEEEEEEEEDYREMPIMNEGNSWTSSNATFKALQSTLDSFTQNPDMAFKKDEMTYKQGKYYPKNLKCRFCPFKASFPYEIAKHESGHEAFLIKRHPCPICGVRFYHLTGLARHVTEEHSTDINAHNIVACAEMMSEQRKKKRKIKPSSSNSTPNSSPMKPSMAPPPPYSIRPEIEIIKQPIHTSPVKNTLGNNSVPSMEIIQHNISPQIVNGMDQKNLTCHICGHKTKWMSELIKHNRVHSSEKPFKCKVCDYECKWKGDLNRHKKMLGHGEITPERDGATSENLDMENEESWNEPNAKRSKLSNTLLGLASPNDDSDKGLHDENFYQDSFDYTEPLEVSIDPKSMEYDFESPNLCDPLVIAEPHHKVKSKNYLYKCPHCTFLSRTASRFHVHIVQHLNTKPFMCSICNYRSNWQWDITKHLKMKGIKDPTHAEGKVILTHETGMRDYGKYKEYLIEVDDEENMIAIEDIKKPNGTEEKQTNDDGESIVITPDISFSGENDNIGNESMMEDLQHPPTADSTEKVFKCGHCNYTKSSKKVVVSHLGHHAGIKPYRCKLCGVSSNWPNTVLKHLKTKHQSDSRNMECLIQYTKRGNIVRLLGITTDNISETNLAEEGIKTIEGSGETPMFSCEHCPYKCEKLYHMKFHMKQHQPREGAIFKCMFCPYYVKFRKSLILHMRLHGISEEESKQMKDNEPKKEIMRSQPDSYLSVLLDQDGEEDGDDLIEQQLAAKKYSCSYCPYTTDNKSQFLYHKQFHRPNKNAAFKCSHCTYWTSRQNLLLQHSRLHKDEDASKSLNENGENEDEVKFITVKQGDIMVKMYQCRHCPMKNKRKSYVRVHEQMHNRSLKSKYSCSICNYQSNNQGALGVHMRLHTGINQNPKALENGRIPPIKLSINSERRKPPYMNCPSCPASFKSVRDLEYHIQFHGAPFPHACTECDYRARHKPHLNKHMMVHTREYTLSRAPQLKNSEQEMQVLEEESEDSSMGESATTNQLFLLEMTEIKELLENKGTLKSHYCIFCPAGFSKVTILNFHMSLHGSQGKYSCQECDYEVNHSKNLSLHAQLHNKTKTVKPKLYSCHKCPASFNKIKRFEKHKTFHVIRGKFICDKCDYSNDLNSVVAKHKLIHNRAKENSTPEFYVSKNIEFPKLKLKKSPQNPQIPSITQPFSPNRNANIEERLKFVSCDFCPYVHSRKEVLTRHLKRHGHPEGIPCPFCNYMASHTSMHKEHVRLHLGGSRVFKPQGFLKYENFEISAFLNQEKNLLFKDKGVNLSENDPEERFFPPIEEELVENNIKASKELSGVLYLEYINSNKNYTDEDETDIDSDIVKTVVDESSKSETIADEEEALEIKSIAEEKDSLSIIQEDIDNETINSPHSEHSEIAAGLDDNQTNNTDIELEDKTESLLSNTQSSINWEDEKDNEDNHETEDKGEAISSPINDLSNNSV